MSPRNINHIEIPAKDREQLAKFYATVFDWKLEDMLAKTGVEYTVWHAGNMRGGIPVADDAGKVGGIIIYIESSDIEADLQAVEANGGKILLDKTPYPAGWYALFADPAGNRLGLTMLKS